MRVLVSSLALPLKVRWREIPQSKRWAKVLKLNEGSDIIAHLEEFDSSTNYKIPTRRSSRLSKRSHQPRRTATRQLWIWREMLFCHAWEEIFHIQRKVQSIDDVLRDCMKVQTKRIQVFSQDWENVQMKWLHDIRMCLRSKSSWKGESSSHLLFFLMMAWRWYAYFDITEGCEALVEIHLAKECELLINITFVRSYHFSI